MVSRGPAPTPVFAGAAISSALFFPLVPKLPSYYLKFACRHSGGWVSQSSNGAFADLLAAAFVLTAAGGLAHIEGVLWAGPFRFRLARNSIFFPVNWDLTALTHSALNNIIN